MDNEPNFYLIGLFPFIVFAIIGIPVLLGEFIGWVREMLRDARIRKRNRRRA